MDSLEKKALKLIAERLNYYLEDKKLSVKELHDLSGISINNIYLILNNDAKGITLSTLVKIVTALDIELSDLFLDQSVKKKMTELQFQYEQLKYEYSFLNLIATNLVDKEAGTNSEETDQAFDDFFRDVIIFLDNQREKSENVTRILDIAKKILKNKRVPKSNSKVIKHLVKDAEKGMSDPGKREK